MAITFVGSYVGTHAAITAQTVAFSNLKDESNNTPTLQENDYVLVAVENASTVDRTQAQLTPSGYTALHTDDYRNDSNDSNFLVSRKFMGASPDTSVDIPASNATTAGVGYAIYVFRGVDTTTPMDQTVVVTGGTNTGIANAASITPATAGAWIVVFGGAAVAAGAVFTNPSGMSATTNHFRSATITTTTNDANIGGAIYTGWTSGAYDPAAFGGSTSTNTGSWSAVTIALRPWASIAASVSQTEAADTLASAATIPGNASLSQTEAADTSTAAASIPLLAALDQAEAADTIAADGTVAAAGITADAAIAEADDTVSAAATLAIAASLSQSEAADTITGAATLAISGSSSVSEDADTASSAAALAMAASLAVSEAADTVSAAATLAIAAALSVTEDADTISASGGYQAIVADAAITEADDSISASAALAIAASLAQTEADDTVSAAATLAIVATVAQDEAADTSTAAATIPITAALDQAEADDTIVSDAGQMAVIVCTVDQVEAGDTPASAGTLAIAATASVSESADTSSATASSAVASALSQVEADDSLASDVNTGQPRTADLAVTEAGDTIAATATVPQDTTVISLPGPPTLQQVRRPRGPRRVADEWPMAARVAVTEQDDGCVAQATMGRTLRERRAAALLLLAA